MRTNMILPVLVFGLLACHNEKRAVADDVPPPPPVEPTGTPIQSVPILGGAERSDSLFFSMERTPCFGTCKAYRIEVYRSGFATYDGRSNVEKQGKHTTRVDQATMLALFNKAESLGFFAMQDKYDGEVTDLPSTVIRVSGGGVTKKVIGRVGQPAGFKALAAFADEQLLPLPWKPLVAEP
ncbi:MAG: hypothetical protein KA941_04550 [Flavobacteriales bacterium]|nr:hypothetical protein [Flavobacteriales bacterium]